tara:strand:- start:286 stop:474 length:189 start_codon:yes stop_codon:yes gene_type:complete
VNTLVESDDVTDVYKTALGLITVWKRDGKDKNGVNGKEGTSRMSYSGPEPRTMTLKKKYRGA